MHDDDINTYKSVLGNDEIQRCNNNSDSAEGMSGGAGLVNIQTGCQRRGNELRVLLGPTSSILFQIIQT